LTGIRAVQKENGFFANVKQWLATDLMDRIANASASLANGNAGGTIAEVMPIQRHLQETLAKSK